MIELPAHLSEKYRLYAIWFDADYGSRPAQDLVIVHVRHPVSFRTFCDAYIFQHLELTVEKTGVKIQTSKISGVQKILNDNKPKYELTAAGQLIEIN